MASFFDGTDCVICKFLGVDRKKLKNKTVQINTLTDKKSFRLINK